MDQGVTFICSTNGIVSHKELKNKIYVVLITNNDNVGII